MIIGGFQKMTMLDFPGKIACTIFTYGCNLRCPFCHNASLVTDKPEEISKDEILSYLKKRCRVLDGVCITGGEPLMHGESLYELIREIRSLGLLVKLDTNGAYPDRLEYVIKQGLVDYVAMDIKNSKEKYALTTGLDTLDISPFEKSVEILKNSDIDYELRTTIIKEYHTIEDIRKIGEWIRGAKRYFLQSFVDSGALISDGCSAHEKSTLEAFKQTASAYISSVQLRGV